MESNKIKSFTQLKAWQEGHKLVVQIYDATKKFPKEEKFCLIDQIRRAVISITSNIAEGFGRETYKDKLRFYYQVNGSLIEVENQLLVAKDVGYIQNSEFNTLANQATTTHILLQGLIKKSRSYVT
jgi:four helix bundle protein